MSLAPAGPELAIAKAGRRHSALRVRSVPKWRRWDGSIGLAIIRRGNALKEERLIAGEPIAANCGHIKNVILRASLPFPADRDNSLLPVRRVEKSDSVLPPSLAPGLRLASGPDWCV